MGLSFSAIVSLAVSGNDKICLVSYYKYYIKKGYSGNGKTKSEIKSVKISGTF